MKYCQWKRRRMQKGPAQGLWGPLLAVARGHRAHAILILSGFWLPLLVVHAEVIRPDICLEILTAALRWARMRGAKTAWLQVVADNAAALSLYRKLGFVEAYRYAYWRKGRAA